MLQWREDEGPWFLGDYGDSKVPAAAHREDGTVHAVKAYSSIWIPLRDRGHAQAWYYWERRTCTGGSTT